MKEARHWLSRGRPVIADGTFLRAGYRRLARRCAEATGAELYIVECLLDDARIKQRLKRRRELGKGLSDATWQTYLCQKEEYEPIEQPSLRLKTTAPPVKLADRVICGLLCRGSNTRG